MRAIVINCSAPAYNLGAHKLGNWLLAQGHEIVTNPDHADLIAMSAIFSWDAPTALTYYRRYHDREIWCGGPGMFALAKWWHDNTGLEAVRGLDPRFERQPGNYGATFASRGCPVNCWFCIVPRIEGTNFTLYWDLQPAPTLCDNNLSALPTDFQEHIIRRYQETGTPLRDANSGFEPRSFTQETYDLWKKILLGPWRFALDDMNELTYVQNMMSILQAVKNSRKKRVYCLIGNEYILQCYERTRKIIEWGGEPYVQPVFPLNALDRHQYMIRYDWTHTLLQDFVRYYNAPPMLWKRIPIWEYSNRKGEPPPFAFLKPKIPHA